MPFEIGKTYKTCWGSARTVVAITTDNRLVVKDLHGTLTFRNSDGTYESTHGSIDFDLIDSDAVSDADKRLLANIVVALKVGYSEDFLLSNSHIKRDWKKALELARVVSKK